MSQTSLPVGAGGQKVSGGLTWAGMGSNMSHAVAMATSAARQLQAAHGVHKPPTHRKREVWRV